MSSLVGRSCHFGHSRVELPRIIIDYERLAVAVTVPVGWQCCESAGKAASELQPRCLSLPGLVSLFQLMIVFNYPRNPRPRGHI